ncbi:hypothetical protein RRG08_049391 [Elysia crispata]|uniref:Uncharacterized protein n=1 Tax=Elysia crispata TaxID=231223 RepID=A0AAE0XDT7_9GAST|nr:hypothetical protein RRG08_049391 [Elysia crispata]
MSLLLILRENQFIHRCSAVAPASERRTTRTACKGYCRASVPPLVSDYVELNFSSTRNPVTCCDAGPGDNDRVSWVTVCLILCQPPDEPILRGNVGKISLVLSSAERNNRHKLYIK